MRPILLFKSYIDGYVKKDGTYVKPHNDKRVKLVAAKVGALKPGIFESPKSYMAAPSEAPDAYWHPQTDDKGNHVRVRYPHKASAPADVRFSDSMATFTPGGDVPAALNGVPFKPWTDAPRTHEEWGSVPGQIDIEEPTMELPKDKTAASGVVIVEPDGRCWLMSPTNRFGGYHQTFPKGQAEAGLSMQANAIKEAFEETGLRVQIVGFLGDFEKTTSVARYYVARRVGGTPADMGWEAQALRLVPKDMLYKMLNMPADHSIAEAIGAGPKPKGPPKSLF